VPSRTTTGTNATVEAGSRPDRAKVAAASDPLAASLAAVSGVGPKRLAALKARGLETFADVLYHLPYRYEDLRRRDRVSDLREGQSAVVEGILSDLKTRPMRGMWSRRMTTANLIEPSGSALRVAWFNLYGDGRMPVGEPVVLYGRVTAGTGGSLEMLHPEVYRLKSSEPPAIRPLYSLPAELPQKLFATIVGEALRRSQSRNIGAIPPELRSILTLPSVAQALASLHQPPADIDIEGLQIGATPAHQALALEEMFCFQLALARDRVRFGRRAGAVLDSPASLSSEFLRSLPYTPTAAQTRAIAEIERDLAAPLQMNRVLIGDVGSGKTLVAFAAILRAVESKWQAVMMAPTELLAEQHFRNFNRMCGPLGVTSVLITGRLTAAERGRVLRALQRGEIAVAFGTHALFQGEVRVGKLGLAIIDEQHRFGVFDRARLVARGSEANVLLMTATPIPRSLAMTLLRNIAVSQLDELPPGRAPITTKLVAAEDLAEADRLLREELKRGNRAYYVLPQIEEEETDDSFARSVAGASKRLAGIVGEQAIGVLHGRMRPAEKDRVMRDFRDGRLKVLVATTVVEVGVDVPEATIIVIAAAERYGLAQLHQLRGRVGRGSAPSLCCLLVSSEANATARARLEALSRTTNGAEVAELDLKTRGPGDLFGTRQSGALPLRFARFIGDLALIAQAGELAEAWIRKDPALESAESTNATHEINKLMALGFSLADIG